MDRPKSLHLAGDGLCVEICPELFYMHDDGLAYVKASNDRTGLIPGTKVPKHQMGGDEGLVDVPRVLEDAAIDAAEECPG